MNRFTFLSPESFVPSKFVSMPIERNSSSRSVLPLSPMICLRTPAKIGSFIAALHFSMSDNSRSASAVLPSAASLFASSARCRSSCGFCIIFAIRVASASQ